MKTNDRKVRAVRVTAVTAVVLGAGSLATAQAAQPSAATTTAASTAPVDQGIPTEVNPAADLAAHTPGSEPTWNDSIYFTSEVTAGGHDFGILVHTVDLPNIDRRTLTVSITDEKTGWYKNYETDIAKDDHTWSTAGLNIEMPGLTWTGDAKNMRVKATTPWGALDLGLKARGPVLNYAGTGTYQMLGERQYEFAVPSMPTTGTLTVQGKTHKATGETWLDRQWGAVPPSGTMRWTWMNLSMPNGDKVMIADIVDGTKENAFTTVLHRDGSYDLASVKPLADGAQRIWTSPTSGKAYPTRWKIEIPSLKAGLNVRLTGTDAQELTGGVGARMEGTASFSGTYQGKHVTGKNFVEMVGNWKA